MKNTRLTLAVLPVVGVLIAVLIPTGPLATSAADAVHGTPRVESARRSQAPTPWAVS